MITARKAAVLLTALGVLLIIAPSTAAAADPDLGNFTEVNNFTDRPIDGNGDDRIPPDPNISRTFIQYNETEETVIFRVELNDSWTPDQSTSIFIDADQDDTTGLTPSDRPFNDFYNNLDDIGADYVITAGEFGQIENATGTWDSDANDGQGSWVEDTGTDTNVTINNKNNNVTLQVDRNNIDDPSIFDVKFAHVVDDGSGDFSYVWGPDPDNSEDDESVSYNLNTNQIETQTSVETVVELEEGANGLVGGPLKIDITLSEDKNEIDSDTLDLSPGDDTDSVEFDVTADGFDGDQNDEVSATIDIGSVGNAADYELNKTSDGGISLSEGDTATRAFKIEDATVESANLTNATGIVETNYPVIQSFVTVDTKNGSDGYLNDTENYTINDGEFIESSGDTEPVEFVQDRDQSTPTDIVFVIDRTNDMDEEIGEIRAKLKSMNTSLTTSRGDLRYGLVTFADSEIEVSEPFTRDISKINNTLDTLGTNDNVVSKYNYEALDKGLNELDYRPEAQQVVINVIDADVDTREQTPAQSDIQTQIENRGINYIAISPGDQRTAELSTAVNGQQYNITNTENAMGEITDSLNQTYILSYTTDDETLSDKRTVEIEADHSLPGEKSSTGTTTYTTPEEFVDVWGVDSSTFPTINTFATIDTEETAIGEGALATNDFRAFRSTSSGLTAQEINTVEYVQDTDDTPTQIVFVVDQTTGQEAAATTIEEEVGSIQDNLESNGRTVEFGLFSYKENIIAERQPLTTSGTAVSDAAGDLKFKPLDNPDRYSYDALNKSIEDTEFDQSAQKMVIHVTDAPADISSRDTSKDLYRAQQSDLERKFKKQGIKYAAISPDADDSNSVKQLAENTNGEWYGSDFDAALGEIETELTETYIVEYESDATLNTEPDRDVRITAGFREPDITGVGTDTGEYYLDNNPTVTLSANETILAPGESARVNVTVDPRGITNLTTAEANISFGPTEYDVSEDSIENGTLIGDNPSNRSSVSNSAGNVFLNQTNTTVDGTTNESGRLGSFVVEADGTALATSQLQFNNATVGDMATPDTEGLTLTREQPSFETDLDVGTDGVQREAAVGPGDSFTVNVTVEDNGHVFEDIGHTLSYDQTVLNATSINGENVAVGDSDTGSTRFLKANSYGFSFYDKNSGEIAYREFADGGTADNGTFYNVTFEVVADSDLSGTINTDITQSVESIETEYRPDEVKTNTTESTVTIEGEMIDVQGELETYGLSVDAPLRMSVTATSPGTVQNVSLRDADGQTVAFASCDVESDGCEETLEFIPDTTNATDGAVAYDTANLTIAANTTDGDIDTTKKEVQIALKGDVTRTTPGVNPGDALAILDAEYYNEEVDDLPWNEDGDPTDPAARPRRDLNNDGKINATEVRIIIDEL